jgi:myo-inositol-1(or 4)-monophosphatase
MSLRTKPSQKDIRKLQEFAEDTARHAGAMLKKGFQKVMDVRYKGRINPVTEWDVKAENYITGQIAKVWPEHSVLAEEGSDRNRNSGYRWVIDPLDGTVNFAHGFPMYCVSIAVEYNSKPIVGAVYDPERDEMFSAGKGLGAKLNGRKIKVSSESKLQRAMLATGFAYDVASARRNNIGYFSRMVKAAQAVRRPGSAAIDLCWLACGRLDGFWELRLHPWDTAAARLVVTEAGGKVTRFDGGAYSIFDDEILASNGRIHRSMQKLLGGE